MLHLSKEKKQKCIWVKYVIYAVLLRFQLYCNVRIFFHQILIPEGEGVYLTVYPESSPNTDTISFKQSLG